MGTFIVSNMVSQVTVTLAVGGGAISADDEGGAYTTLTGPVIVEAAKGDIGNGTFILNAPAGFEFDVGGTAPTVDLTAGFSMASKNINGASVGDDMAITSRTTSQIVFTITDDSDSQPNTITFQDVRIRPSDGVATTGTLLSSGTSTVVGVTHGTTSFGALAVVPGAFVKVQLILPGETAVPGPSAGTGKIGTPNAQTAGTAFLVTVNAVDAHYNIVTSVTDVIEITSSDPDAVLPANAALVAGTNDYAVKFKTAGSYTVTATDFDDGTITADTSPAVTVNAGAFAKLQILMPGETADPGSATGKTGSPNAQTAGTAFSVTVNAVDDCWNLVNTVTDIVGITSSDANATLPANAALVAGTQTYSVTPKTAGTATFTATDISDGTKSPDTSPSTTINTGAFTKLQLILPGQTAAPGTATGFTGTAFSQSVGTSFAVTVNAVDDCFNVVTSVTDVVGITSTDGSATLPADAALVAGTKAFSVALNASGIWDVTATDITDGSKTADTKSVSTVLSVLTLAIGGSAISADDQGGSYTSLLGPIYKEGNSGDFGVGTVILNAPTGLEFDVGGTAPTLLMNRVGGAGADALNINGLADGSTIALTSITTTQITFTITTASSAGVTCQLTYQDVRVRPSSGAGVSDKLTSTGTSSINGVISSVTNWGTLTVVAGAFAKMQILVPGETSDPGTVSGRTGTVTDQTAGTPFNVTVNAVDAFWNLVNTVTDVVGITSSDPDATLPGNAALSAGTRSFTVTLKTSGTQTLTVTNISDGTKTAHTSSNITVDPGPLARLQILLPGETADPGSDDGKTGSPTDQTAGTAFNVTVNAVDACWNVVTSVTDVVGITSSDVNATLPVNAALVAGTQTFTITLKTSDSTAITASDITDGTVTPGVSDSVWVNPGAFTKLQILVPGETADPGTATGKTGTPLPQSNGKAFDLTVNAVDACWNIVPTAPADNIGITSTDGSATLPANNTLSSGTQTFSFTFNNSGTYTITATDLSDGTKTANTTPSITVEDAVLTEATGGTGISADTYGGAWTTLTGPIYDEGTSADIGLGTITLDAPTGFIFDVGGTAPTVLMTRLSGGGSSSKNINGVASGTSMAITSITSTKIVFTVTGVSNSSAVCRLTWQDVRVRPSTGAVISGELRNSGTSSMTVVVAGTNFGSLSVVPGAFAKMQLLVPGETASPGAGSGKVGSPSDRTAGVAFNVTVNAVDANWNVVTTAPADNIGITSSDVNATLPANNTLSSGTQTFSVTLKTAGIRTITATNLTDGTKTADTSPNITVVAGAFVKMQLLVPGETADPGTATGKTGTPNAQTACTSFSVTVNAVDACWNVVSSTHTVGITSSDGNATLPSDAPLVAGTETFTITLRTAGTSTLTATNISDGSKTADTSPSITVNAGAFTKLQILAPGESAAPGTATGKTGTPTTQQPGTAFNVTVNAVDDCWNLVNTVTDVVGITSTDGSATLPANAALVSGTRNFSVTFGSTGTFTVTATDISDGTKTASTSSDIVSGCKTWNGGAGTSLWSDAANWNPAGSPLVSECVVLDGAHTIDIDVAAVTEDLTLNNTALTLTVLTGNSLSVGGDFTITDGIFATQESWPTVTGTTTISDGTVVYNGIGAQIIENSVTYKTLRFDNAAGSMTVEAGGDITAEDGLEMYSGNVDMNGRAIKLGSGSAAPLVHLGATTTLYNGTFSRYLDAATAVNSTAAPLYGLFPVGTSTDYRPFEINSTVSPTGAGCISSTHTDDATVDVTYTDNEGDDIERIKGSTEISITGLTGGTYDVTMTMTNLNSTGVLTDIKLLTYDGTMGSVGTSAATTGTVSDPVVKRTGISVSDLGKKFVVGTKDKSATPLPVELVYFNALLNIDRVDVSWQTATEINNDYFTVERSKDGVNWEKVIETDGAGDSRNFIDYFEIDSDPLFGVSYYRLKQTDRDGSFSYSSIVPVTNNIYPISGKDDIELYPNPIEGGGSISILFTNVGNEEAFLVIKDIQGKAYYSEEITGVLDSKIITIPIAEDIPRGIYLIKAASGDKVYSKRLIVK